MSSVSAFLVALALAGVHLVSPRVEHVTERWRGSFTAFAGGLSVGYVFLYLLPKLADYREAVTLTMLPPALRQEAIFTTAMFGLLAYMILARGGATPESSRRAARLEAVFAIIYSIVLGAIVGHPRRMGTLVHPSLLIGFGGHVLAMNHQLRGRFGSFFDKPLRHVLAVAVLGGWALAAWHVLPEPTYAFLAALVAGMTIVTVMREEIPDNASGRTVPLLLGVALAFVLVTAVLLSTQPVAR